MRKLSILGACVALGVSANAAIPTAFLSSVAGATNNVVPGAPTDTWTTTGLAFDAIRFSPDGSRWVAVGLIEAGTTDHEAVIYGTDFVASNASMIARRGQVVPWGTTGFQNIDNNDGVFITNSGTIYFSGDDDNTTTTLDGFLASFDGSAYSLLKAEGTAAVGDVPAGSLYFGSFNSINVSSAGVVNHFATTGTSSGAGRRTFYQDSTVLFRAQQTAINNLAGNATTFSTFSDGSFRMSDSGNDYLFMGTLSSPSGGNVVIRNGAVIAERLSPLPGGVFTSNISNLYTNSTTVSSSGGVYGFIGSNADTEDWVYLNGNIVATTDDPITPFSSVLWDDTNYGQCFFSLAANNLGEYVLGGVTNETDPERDAKLVCNGRVIMTESDEIDMTGDGVGDGVFLDNFNNNNHYLSDNLIYTFGAYVQNAAGTRIGHALIQYYIPIPGDVDGDDEVGPGDFAQLAFAFGSEVGDPNYNAAADFDGNGEIGPNDFAILSSNFGRSRF